MDRQQVAQGLDAVVVPGRPERADLDSGRRDGDLVVFRPLDLLGAEAVHVGVVGSALADPHAGADAEVGEVGGELFQRQAVGAVAAGQQD